MMSTELVFLLPGTTSVGLIRSSAVTSEAFLIDPYYFLFQPELNKISQLFTLLTELMLAEMRARIWK
jgi:hypothetical protein